MVLSVRERPVEAALEAESSGCLEEVVRGLSCGPWDSSEVEPAALTRCGKHHLGRYVYTPSGRFWVPFPMRIGQDAPVGGVADRLMVTVGVTSVQISILAAPKSEDLWHNQQRRDVYEQFLRSTDQVAYCEAAGATAVFVRAPRQEVLVLGVDGPRWMVQLMVFTPELTETDLAWVHELLVDFVVMRGEYPAFPGQALDVTVLRSAPIT
ncbi:DUF3710 domain-containing protein [Corynebacterium mastitidis]